MQLLGIPLRKPAFNELTAATIMGAGLWVLAVGVMHGLQLDLGAMDAGALLVVLLWGCISVRVGIRVGQGQRHLVANLLVTAALLGAYQSAWALAG
ncbi:MAG TPA: hypothetical protein VFL64_02845 [Rhizobacter sp.]|nr:hypothetical protein [Rhizobacter sp.]